MVPQDASAFADVCQVVLYMVVNVDPATNQPLSGPASPLCQRSHHKVAPYNQPTCNPMAPSISSGCWWRTKCVHVSTRQSGGETTENPRPGLWGPSWPAACRAPFPWRGRLSETRGFREVGLSVLLMAASWSAKRLKALGATMQVVRRRRCNWRTKPCANQC